MSQAEGGRRVSPGALGVLIALGCAVYQLLLASDPLNDQFMSVVWGREHLFAQLPVRDFFEAGEPLTEWISAAAAAIVGYRLLAEGLVVAIAMGLGTWVVFWVTRQLTESTPSAALAASLVAIAGGRSYSYPKILIYAVAAALIWRYLQRQSSGRLAALACWIGAAFLWRHDHGVYLALATTFTISLAHGFTRAAVTRIVQAGALTMLIVGPYLGWVQINRGIVSYVIDGRSVVASELNDHAPFRFPAWPLRRFSDLVRIQPQSAYAPLIDIKWTEDSTHDERQAVLERFQLINDQGVSRQGSIRLLNPGAQNIRAFVNDPLVEDTKGIDRRTSSVPYTSWSIFDRLRFRFPWLRIDPLPAFDDVEAAGLGAAWLFFMLSIGALVWSGWPGAGQDTAAFNRRKTILALATLALISIPGLLRQPFSVYAPDVVVLPAILAGWVAWELWRANSRHVPNLAWGSRPVAVVLCTLLLFSAGGVGQLRERISWLSGNWMSFARANATWVGAWRRLVATPPISIWDGQQAPKTVILARYIRACTKPATPLLVVAFSPDLQFYADRPLASRHLLLGAGRWTSVDDQEMSLAKMRRSPPPIVIAQEPFYSTTFATEYSLMADYVRNEYVVSGTLPDKKERVYLVLTRADLSPSGSDPDSGWPCFEPSQTLVSR